MEVHPVDFEVVRIEMQDVHCNFLEALPKKGTLTARENINRSL
jgi:hypothetical protein